MSDKNIKPLSNTETAAFCSQMAMILKSGISSVEGISILLEDVDDPDEKNLLTVLNDTLIKTGDFSQSLKSTGAFPDYMVHMVTLGEQAGRLDEVMASLSDYYDKEAALNQTIRSAVTYPLIMILMMLLVILVLITKIMPIFNQVFKQLGSEMSGLSLAILQAGEFLNSHAIVCAIVCAVLIILFFYLFRTERGHRTLRTWARHLPGMRTLSERISSSRFANGMALTLSSGLTPQECLQLTYDLIEDDNFHQRLKLCTEDVADGEDLCEVLQKRGVFSGLYAKMASLGSRTGMLDEVMRKIADQYEEEINTRLSGVIAAIEPTLVIILSLIVGLILLSVMLPLISIMAGF